MSMNPKGLSRKICRIAKARAKTEKRISTTFQEKGRLLEIPSSLMGGPPSFFSFFIGLIFNHPTSGFPLIIPEFGEFLIVDPLFFGLRNRFIPLLFNFFHVFDELIVPNIVIGFPDPDLPVIFNRPFMERTVSRGDARFLRFPIGHGLMGVLVQGVGFMNRFGQGINLFGLGLFESNHVGVTVGPDLIGLPLGKSGTAVPDRKSVV